MKGVSKHTHEKQILFRDHGMMLNHRDLKNMHSSNYPLSAKCFSHNNVLAIIEYFFDSIKTVAPASLEARKSLPSIHNLVWKT